MKKQEKEMLDYEYEQLQHKFNNKLSYLSKLNPENINYLDFQSETIKLFEELKKTFVKNKWNPCLKEQKMITLLCNIAYLCGETVLAYIIANLVFIFNVGEIPINSFIIGIPAGFISGGIITSMLYHCIHPLVNRVHTKQKIIKLYKLEKCQHDLERILYQNHMRTSAEIIDVKATEVIIKESSYHEDNYDYLYEENTIFTLPKPNGYSYTKTKKF